MSRTTPSDVKEILDTTLSDATIQAYIDVANDVVDTIVSTGTVDSDTATRIEKFYTAHLATAQEREASDRSAGNRSVSYEGFDTEGQSSYFEIANSLDPTGTITATTKRKANLSTPDVKGIYD